MKEGGRRRATLCVSGRHGICMLLEEDDTLGKSASGSDRRHTKEGGKKPRFLRGNRSSANSEQGLGKKG